MQCAELRTWQALSPTLIFRGQVQYEERGITLKSFKQTNFHRIGPKSVYPSLMLGSDGRDQINGLGANVEGILMNAKLDKMYTI